MRRRAALAALLVIGVAGVSLGVVMSAADRKKAALEPPRPTTEFDPKNAFRYLVEICKLGPRITASPAMKRQQELLKAHFEALGATVELQEFVGAQPSLRGRPFQGANLVVRWHPESKRRVLLGAHYDTRPVADREPVLARQKRFPFLGANDGASGVAFLMELGRLLPGLELAVGVDFVLFDAEEYILVPDLDKYFLGSEHFVREYVRGRPEYRYEAVIVVDMIGDRDLQIHPDVRSDIHAGPLVHEVWSIARELRVDAFKSGVKHDILDDHVAFQEAGIPAIVLIDFDYPHWHRVTDTPERCSGESLEKVAKVLLEWLRRRK